MLPTKVHIGRKLESKIEPGVGPRHIWETCIPDVVAATANKHNKISFVAQILAVIILP